MGVRSVDYIVPEKRIRIRWLLVLYVNVHLMCTQFYRCLLTEPDLRPCTTPPPQTPHSTWDDMFYRLHTRFCRFACCLCFCHSVTRFGHVTHGCIPPETSVKPTPRVGRDNWIHDLTLTAYAVWPGCSQYPQHTTWKSSYVWVYMFQMSYFASTTSKAGNEITLHTKTTVTWKGSYEWEIRRTEDHSKALEAAWEQTKDAARTQVFEIKSL